MARQKLVKLAKEVEKKNGKSVERSDQLVLKCGYFCKEHNEL